MTDRFSVDALKSKVRDKVGNLQTQFKESLKKAETVTPIIQQSRGKVKAMSSRFQKMFTTNAGTKVMPDSGTQDEQFFRDWEKALREKMEQEKTLPKDIPNQEAFVSACQKVHETSDALVQAERTLDRTKQDQKEAYEKAKKDVEDAKARLNETMANCQKVAADVLDELEKTGLFSDRYEDTDLMILLALVRGDAKKLATWCEQGDQQTEQLLGVLSNPDILRQWHAAGGPSENNYGRSAEIAALLKPSTSDPVLKRLALAVTLELAGPAELMLFNKEPLNPVARYQHYERAYLDGDLDPAFSSFTAWQMRMIINNDAPEDQFSYARDGLRNYRPDLVIQPDTYWRYSMIVRTEMAYRVPEFYQEPHSYDQLLSAGGMCGPRAWYGRFICKAFGIPTWGTRQPGHAALARWTLNGWVTNLGLYFDASEWCGRCGFDFQLETQAREALTDGVDDSAFMKQVLRLEWIGKVSGETDKLVRERMVTDPKNLWYGLSLMQRKLIVARNPDKRPQIQYTGKTKIEALQKRADDFESIQCRGRGSPITIPGTATSKPTQSGGSVLFMKSFLGGQQMVLWHNAEVEYTLNADMLPTEPKAYNLTFYLCTAHQKEFNLVLTITNEGSNTCAEHRIPMPYTNCMWMETPPVTIQLGGGSAKLHIKRNCQLGGIAVKYLKLTPA